MTSSFSPHQPIDKHDYTHHLPSLSSSSSPSPQSQHEQLNTADWAHAQDKDYTMEDSFLYLTECLAQDQEETPFTLNTNIKPELQIRVHGVPSTGAKSRVETQIKLCVQLVTNQDAKVQNWSYLRLHDNMLARSKQKKSQQKSRMDGNLSTLLSDESNILTLEAKVICASNEAKQVRMCHGCVKRERKRAERSKDGKTPDIGFATPNEDEHLEAERDRILLFNCGPMVSFSSGDAILPTRITCYCRHHNEKIGFRVRFTMRNDRGTLVATGDSPPILITDDHKSLKQRGRKRSRQDTPDSPIIPSRRTSVTDSPSPEIPNIALPTPVKDLPRWLQCIPTPTTSLLDFIEQSPGPHQDDIANPFPEEWPFNQRRRTFSTQLSTPPIPLSLPLSPHPYQSQSQHQYHQHEPTSPVVVPHIDRIVPNRGPTCGGTEITILGSGFCRDLTCVFGEHAAKTVYWNTNTLVCVLPPVTTPGPVVVTFKEHPLVLGGQDITLFTYYDAALLGYEELVAALLPATTNIDLPDKNGCTAFHLACTTPSLAVCKLLIEAGADPLAPCGIASVRENTSNVLKMLASIDISNSFIPKHANPFQSHYFNKSIARRGASISTSTSSTPSSPSLSLSDLPLLASLLSIVQS
ncbi:hypothetical protein PHYBLDRAFT_189303 [Phycomyces blakesleeanus NRRL 1555(-)]|uniref:IPT/TIG domain-containing protein n=1 Tax=Phycomyces blakesleeanus (strain ATCC 8743b / DSM 1359 / FGSC 10004 / NBRC 33097 / NRRL 1555) TaxID=763407 RepID=A0A167JNV2_PHYB8|nr:hypothetical protein PHYBLDRAFT_189303 [Phycomyces blakesleeanus NRRL 1555(-)]OAD66397.1 hypothetical protein PHYBLDRAFT_189303 [Phycomyces blakesleeanus NRRL 1555(-)]|eukprot:XP_018284437.1 hypothetical protein PHYBLDRAFT_189303 [Phycomyces blakesleeanus NRRL 1555(-)]